jgi:hypothetical protein
VKISVFTKLFFLFSGKMKYKQMVKGKKRMPIKIENSKKMRKKAGFLPQQEMTRKKPLTNVKGFFSFQ